MTHPTVTAETPAETPAENVESAIVGVPIEGEALERAARRSAATKQKKTFTEKIEAFVSRLGSRNNFWHRVTSLVFLPYAFRSGIVMRKKAENTFAAVLPFRRFNKNWYNAMAGAALLGNSEIAGGMYVFGFCGGDYTVVCKHLSYKFLRPCFGPAEYRVTPSEDIEALIADGGEFNITLDMSVVQVLPTELTGKLDRSARKRRKKRKADREAKRDAEKQAGGRRSREERLERLKKREKRVGKATITFHVTPKAHHKAKAERKAAGLEQQASASGDA